MITTLALADTFIKSYNYHVLFSVRTLTIPSLSNFLVYNTLTIITISSISSVQSLSRIQLFATPWTAAHQAFLFITNSQRLFKLMFIGSVTPSNHLILCHFLLLPPSTFPSIRVFSSESVLCIRWS